MDPTIAAGFSNLTLLSSQRGQLQGHVDHSVLERMLIQGGDAANYADMTTASHVPTVQPYVVPNVTGTTGATLA